MTPCYSLAMEGGREGGRGRGGGGEGEGGGGGIARVLLPVEAFVTRNQTYDR